MCYSGANTSAKQISKSIEPPFTPSAGTTPFATVDLTAKLEQSARNLSLPGGLSLTNAKDPTLQFQRGVGVTL